ncbi:MAG: pre-peptidase C-terminal domain-containing protein [Cyanobacteria bacterium P01_F01_bin.86]
MVQVSLSTSTNFAGDLNALVEDQGTALTVRLDLDEPAPAGGLKVYFDSDVEQILNRLDLPEAIANPQIENLNLFATQTNFDNSGLAVEITEGATFATVTLNIFDNEEPDTFLPATFDGLVEATLSLVTADQIASEDQSSITGVGDYTIAPNAASSTVLFADDASQLPGAQTPPQEPAPEPPAPELPAPEAPAPEAPAPEAPAPELPTSEAPAPEAPAPEAPTPEAPAPEAPAPEAPAPEAPTSEEPAPEAPAPEAPAPEAPAPEPPTSASDSVNFITPIAEAFEASYSTQSLGRVPLDTGGFVPAGYGGIAFLDDDTLLVTGNPYSPEATIYEVDVTRDAETNSITGFAGSATFFAEAPGIGSLAPEGEPEPGGLDGGLTVAPNGTILYATYGDNSIGQILPGSTAPDTFIDLTALGVEPSTGSLEIVPEGSPGEGRLKITSFDAGTLYDASLIENADGTYDITVDNTVALDTPDLFGGIEGLDYVDESNPGFTTDSVLISEYDTNNISAFEVDELGNPIVDTERTFLDGLTGSGAGGSFDLIVDPVTGDLLVSYDSAFTADDADQGGRLLLITDEAPPTATADNDPFDNAVALDIASGSATASGAVSTSNDVYAINATAGELLSIEIDATEALTGIAYTNDDTQLYLYNEAGDVLAFSEDKPDSFASNLFNYLVPETGTYYAAVTTAGNEPILELGAVNQLLGFEETGLANVVYDITVDAQDVPATARLFDIALEADPDNPIGNALINGDEVLFIDLNGTRNTDITGALTIEVNAEEVNSPENTLDNTIVFEDTLSFGLDVFDFILDFDEPFASTDVEDIVDTFETSGITAIIPPDQLIQRIVFTEQFIDEQVGSDDGETIVGANFRVSIDGQGGDDTIAGGLGDDLIQGGDGDDVLRGDLNTRSPQDGEAGGNDIIFGGEGNDRIGGKAGNDILSGDAGDDLIWGDDGDDIIMGVTGNDTLVGDNGSNGSGSDLFVFGNGDGTDTIVDFEVGVDRIGLVEGELTFADLTLTQDGNNTLLGVANSGEVIAVLNDVQASGLTESSFEVVPDVSNPEEALALI